MANKDMATKTLRDVEKQYPDLGNSSQLNLTLFNLANFLASNYGKHTELEIMGRVVQEIAEALDVSGLVVVMVQHRHQSSLHEREVFASGNMLPVDRELFHAYLADTVLNEVKKKRATVTFDNVHEEILKEMASKGGHTRIGSLLGVPMMWRGQIAGALIAMRAEVAGFQEGQLRTFEQIGRFIAQEILESRLFHKATLDESTGLFHRQAALSYLRREIERADRYEAPLTLSLVDVDGFSFLEPYALEEKSKGIMKQLATRLLDEVRQVDICGRIFDDTFMVVHPMSELKQGIQIAQRIRRTLQASPLIVDENKIEISVSTGVASYMSGQDDVATLISRADTLLEAAKRTGGNSIVHD